MTPETVWERYASIWSMPAGKRAGELAACLSATIAYCDPERQCTGLAELAAYMDEFQRRVPGGLFRIRAVYPHHQRTLAEWTLHGADGTPIMDGISFARLDQDGRLHDITGFFPIARPGTAT